MTDASPDAQVDTQTVAQFIDVATASVESAGQIALGHFRSGLSVTDKQPGQRYDPVTEADRNVETFIRAELNRAFPSHKIVGEEFGTTGLGPISWVLDPIDGTRAFISGLPTWGTLLGLTIDEVAVGGVMHQPFTAETWRADSLHGARYKRGAGEWQPLRTRTDATLEDASLFTTHPVMVDTSELKSNYAALAARVRLQAWGGDCYGFAMLASGCIDLMIDALLKPYDIVALIPIIEHAGGVVTDLAGQSPVAGGTVVAAANAQLHAAALEILRA